MSDVFGRIKMGFGEDLISGFIVMLIAIPLSLSIAMASGFPPVSGLITAIVGGGLVSFMGSSRLTIKGPAAGLMVVVIAAVHELGMGDPIQGYRRALAVGVMAAALQVLLALAGAASLGVVMSPSVIKGMLAAIGVLILSEQIHTTMGVSPTSEGPFALLKEIPTSLSLANPEVLIIGVLSLFILFTLPAIKARWARWLPGPMVVIAVAIPLGYLFDLEHHHIYSFMSSSYELGPQYLVQLPGNLLDSLAFPDFSVAFTAASLKYVVMFALLGTIESTLTVLAVDTMDPQHRSSDLNHDLLGVGVGNLICSMLGGLPMISEIIRSRANVEAGAKTAKANFFHGLLLLGVVTLVPGLIHRIPLAALAAILVYMGSRLASPWEFKRALELGPDQLLLFIATLILTLMTNLLIGVALGLALKVLLHIARGAPVKALFQPEVEVHTEGEELRVILRGVAAFPSLLKLQPKLKNIPNSVTRVVVDLRAVGLVDHTFLERLQSISREWSGVEVQLLGLDALKPESSHPQATRSRSIYS